MTIQVGHLYRHGNIDYSIVSSTNSVPFDPKDYGVVPFPRCTACHRGYWCCYTAADTQFVLDDYSLTHRTIYIRQYVESQPPWKIIGLCI